MLVNTPTKLLLDAPDLLYTKLSLFRSSHYCYSESRTREGEGGRGGRRGRREEEGGRAGNPNSHTAGTCTGCMCVHLHRQNSSGKGRAGETHDFHTSALLATKMELSVASMVRVCVGGKLTVAATSSGEPLRMQRYTSRTHTLMFVRPG